MASEVTLDRFGRVVIPKGARDRFGLGPGASLRVDERDEGILLTPALGEPVLRKKGSLTVFSGELIGDAEDALRRVREQRLGKLAPARRPMR